MYTPNTSSFGRRGFSGVATDTVPVNSAEQAMLLQMDQLVAYMNAIVSTIQASTSASELQTALVAACSGLQAITPIKLIP